MTELKTLFAPRFERLREAIYDANPELASAVKANKLAKKEDADEEAVKRSVMAYWAQAWERQCLEAAIMHLVYTREIKVEDVVYCYDGVWVVSELGTRKVDVDALAAKYCDEFQKTELFLSKALPKWKKRYYDSVEIIPKDLEGV